MTLTIGPLLGIKLATWRFTDQHLIHPKSSLQYRLHAVMGDLQITSTKEKTERRKRERKEYPSPVFLSSISSACSSYALPSFVLKKETRMKRLGRSKGQYPATAELTLPQEKFWTLHSHVGQACGVSTQQSFIRGGFARRSTPLRLVYHF